MFASFRTARPQPIAETLPDEYQSLVSADSEQDEADLAAMREFVALTRKGETASEKLRKRVNAAIKKHDWSVEQLASFAKVMDDLEDIERQNEGTAERLVEIELERQGKMGLRTRLMEELAAVNKALGFSVNGYVGPGTLALEANNRRESVRVAIATRGAHPFLYGADTAEALKPRRGVTQQRIVQAMGSHGVNLLDLGLT
jgi:hypothetical protein